MKHEVVLNYHEHQGRHAGDLCASAGLFTGCLLSAVAVPSTGNREPGCPTGAWRLQSTISVGQYVQITKLLWSSVSSHD